MFFFCFFFGVLFFDLLAFELRGDTSCWVQLQSSCSDFVRCTLLMAFFFSFLARHLTDRLHVVGLPAGTDHDFWIWIVPVYCIFVMYVCSLAFLYTSGAKNNLGGGLYSVCMYMQSTIPYVLNSTQ